MSDLWVILSVALVSFGLRSSFIAFATNRALPDGVERVIDHLKPAAFAGLATTAMASHSGVEPPHLLAILAVGWTARRGNLLTAFGVGFAVLLVGMRLQ